MKELTLRAVTENIPAVTDFINGQLEALGCPVKARIQFDTAVDELFSNIANYAYGSGTGDAEVRFSFDAATRTVCVAFSDGGTPFDPLSLDDPDVTSPAEERRIGGLGIFLVRKLMDRMEYRYENGRNLLSIYKRI